MTYCVGIKLDAGLVFLSDSRTNAGLDQISTFRKMMVYEKPGDRFMVLLSAGNLSISQSVREILQVEQIDNGKGELLPGAYTEVHFKLPPNAESLRLPPTVILFRAAGLEVATVGADNRVTLKKIVQGRDFGSSIEVLAGVTVGDNIIMNPPDSITDGAQVHIVELPKEKAAAPQDHKDKAP